jgi:hypothetical protein
MPITNLDRDKGSKARCNTLMSGTRDEVASRLSDLAAPFGSVATTDSWMPDGYTDVEEAELHKAERLLDLPTRKALTHWWLTSGNPKRRTPTFDIASTCTIDGETGLGLLLVEAKAHHQELRAEKIGRREIRTRKDKVLTERQRDHQRQQHAKIGEAISASCAGLARATSLRWAISYSSSYQMSNRFAWAYKLTELGTPVILVYLGFLNAQEMRSPHRTVLVNDSDWLTAVKAHSESLFPAEVWGHQWTCNGHAFIPLIKSMEVAFSR